MTPNVDYTTAGSYIGNYPSISVNQTKISIRICPALTPKIQGMVGVGSGDLLGHDLNILDR